MSQFNFSRPAVGSSLSLSRPSGIQGFGFKLSSAGARMSGSSDTGCAPGVKIVTGPTRPQYGEFLFLSSDSEMTGGGEDVLRFATESTYGGEDFNFAGFVYAVEETGDDCHWVVTFERGGVCHVNNIWDKIVPGELPPETLLGLSRAHGVLIPWIGQPTGIVTNPINGVECAEILATFTLHKRVRSGDNTIVIISNNENL